LRIESVKGEQKAIETHRWVGARVRKTMQDMGNTLPENLPAAASIKKLASAKAREIKRPKSGNER
jgi:DNA-damage-inducible protein D